MAGSWDEWPPPSRPRRVEGGIKARSRRGQIGERWWSQRFISILEAFGMGPRLQRGRAYARAGQVLDLAVASGTVSARVQGSRARPYRVRIGLDRFPEADWTLVESALAARALYSAKLLTGEMPPTIEEVFGSCGLSLFPSSASELELYCSCPDWAVPCKHIAATFYLLAEAFDSDPFLVLAWRGRGRDDLLARLRGLRALTGPAADVPVGVDDGGPDRGAIEDPPLPEQLDRFWSPRGDLAARRGGGTAATAPDLLLLGLEAPDVQPGGRGLVELLVPAYHAMAAARMCSVGAIGDTAVMSKPQQPELGRSGHTPVVEGEHAREAVEVQGRPAAEGSPGPVPEDNRPGHHPDTEQDKPDAERYRSRMAGDDSEG